jgi:hypothetical protein
MRWFDELADAEGGAFAFVDFCWLTSSLYATHAINWKVIIFSNDFL